MIEQLESVPREVLLIVWAMAAGHLLAYVITMLIGVIQRDTSTALGRESDREYRWIVRGTILWPIALPYLAARACWRWWRGRWKARKNLRQARCAVATFRAREPIAKHGLVYMQPDGTVSPASLSGEAAAERLRLCERNLEYVQGRSLPSGARQHAQQMLDAAKAEYDAAFPHVPYASKPPSGTGSAPEAPWVTREEWEAERQRVCDVLLGLVQRAQPILDALEAKRGAWRGWRSQMFDTAWVWDGEELWVRWPGHWRKSDCGLQDMRPETELHGQELDALVAEFEARHSNPPKTL